MAKRSPILSRRNFLKTTGTLAGIATVSGLTPPLTAAPATNKKNNHIEKRKLGRTGLKISSISIGTASGQPVNVLRYGMDKGINFIHTSIGYAGGRAVKNVAQAIKGRRKDVVLGLKITWSPTDMNAMDRALEKLGVQQTDIAFFNIHNDQSVKQPKYAKAAKMLKETGKCKYIGVTSHGHVAGCMHAAIDSGWCDVLMPSYNLSMKKSFTDIFDKAKKKNIGIVLMKTAKNLGGNTYAEAVPAYLSTPGVTTINKTLTSFRAIDSILEWSNNKISALKMEQLHSLAELSGIGQCAMCGKCTDVCPENLAVSDLVRCSDYYLTDYEYYDIAKEVYTEASPSRSLKNICGDCTVCENNCPGNVPIKHHLLRAEKILS